MQSRYTGLETVKELTMSCIPVRPLKPGKKAPWPDASGAAQTYAAWRGEEAQTWFRQHPEANMGACLSPIDASPIVVVDVDLSDVPTNEHQRVWARLAAVDVVRCPTTWIQRTGRGNFQFFYFLSAFEQPPLRHTNADGLHIDLLSNGYVVVPPSNTNLEPPKHPGAKGGGPYQWVRGYDPWTVPLSDLTAAPPKLLAWWQSLTATSTLPPSAPLSVEGTGNITEYRNVTLTRMAGALSVKYGPDESGRRLRRINLERCVPPLPEREVATIIASIGKREDTGRAKDLGADTSELRFLR